jgi:formylglycine-generating enzyme required for sulfatase activity
MHFLFERVNYCGRLPAYWRGNWLMTTCGPYQIVEELSLTPQGSVARARKIGEEKPLYIVKRFTPPPGEPNEPHWESAAFLDRARAQQQLVAGGAIHWAPIRQVGVSECGPWLASDYLPLSAQKLIDGKIELKSSHLYSTIHCIVEGLVELNEGRGRANGNLKPSNILFAGKDLNSAKVLLTDLGSAAQATKAGELGDVYAIGEVLFALVMHRPRESADPWPLTDTAQWEKLGPHGSLWRQLCNDMLVPVASLRLPLASVARRLEELAPPRRLHHVSRLVAAALIPLALLLAAFLTIASLERSARKQFAASQQQWFGALAAALTDPSHRPRYEADTTLNQVIGQIDRQHLAGLDASSRSPLHASVHDWRQFKAANATVAEIRQELSPARWATLSEAMALREHLEELAWPQPAEFVGQLVDNARIGSANDPAPGIDRLLTIVPRIKESLPAAQTDWKRLLVRAREIQGKNDKLLSAMADSLRTSAAAAVQVSDAGFFRLDEVNQNAQLMERLADAVRWAWPDDVDRPRLRRDTATAMDVDHLRRRDIEQFLTLLALNTVRHDEASLAASTLRKRLDEASAKVSKSHPDAEETVAFERDRADAAAQILAFEQSPFTLRMISDGTLGARRRAIEARVDALMKYYHPDGPEDWLKSLPTHVGSSDRVIAYWNAWRELLTDGNTVEEMTQNRKVFAAYQRRAKDLEILLAKLDSEFPPVAEGLSESFTRAARMHREQELNTLLALIDRDAIQLDPAKVQAAHEQYLAWSRNLVALAADFPIRKEILRLEDRPDEKWKQKPQFWDDPAIVLLVKPDLQRIARLQGLRDLSRADLVKTAGEAREAEVALEAWQLLGSDLVHPAWPARAGELASDLGLRAHVLQTIHALGGSADAQSIEKESAQQEATRWQRFVQNASSESMLEEAIKSQRAAGATAEQIAALSPAARYNLWAFVLYRGVAQNSDALVREAMPNLRGALAQLNGTGDLDPLRARLAELEAKEPLADLNPGEIVSLPGITPAMQFHRVEPAEGRPFYLATTEVSLAQFQSVVQSAAAWPQAVKLPWPAAPGAPDKRHGPRVWEWSGQPILAMSSPQYWLAPDEDNDFPIPLRAGRFNRMVLAEGAGGPPEPDHPMQQISAQGALFFAGLCGCRLPTPREWQAAYEKFEKIGPTERWNLRDQTWAQQQKYVAQTNGARWPDDGIFRPEGANIPAGASATAAAYSDGVLYFRHVNSPASGSIFHHLVGNVSEYLCAASNQFERWTDKKTAEGVRNFAMKNTESFFIIGGSALSPPQVPVDKPLALEKTDQGYADVGLRLAFTAPARTLAEKARWTLGEPHYLWPAAPAEAQAKAK